MASRHEEPRHPDLDHWLAEVGEDYITGLVNQTRRGVADGTIPTFSDKDALLRHLARASLDKPA